MTTYIGKPLTRKEDVRFITGRGKYTDDFKFQHLLHAAILRSPHPHARILSIDTSKAREIPGVEAVFTFQDVADTLEPRPSPSEWPRSQDWSGTSSTPLLTTKCATWVSRWRWWSPQAVMSPRTPATPSTCATSHSPRCMTSSLLPPTPHCYTRMKSC